MVKECDECLISHALECARIRVSLSALKTDIFFFVSTRDLLEEHSEETLHKTF